MIDVHLQFATVQEAAAFFAPHNTAFAIDASPSTSMPIDANQLSLYAATTGELEANNDLPKSEVIEQEQPVVKKTRAKKEATAPAAAEPGKKSAAVSEVADQDLRDALAKFIEDNDFTAGQALVKQHGGDRVSAIPQENRAAFVKAATA